MSIERGTGMNALSIDNQINDNQIVNWQSYQLTTIIAYLINWKQESGYSCWEWNVMQLLSIDNQKNSLFSIDNNNATSSHFGYQLTKRLSINNENDVLDWQRINSEIGWRLTNLSIDKVKTNPCQLREEMEWKRCQSTTRLMIAELSIDNAFVNWQRERCCRWTTN